MNEKFKRVKINFKSALSLWYKILSGVFSIIAIILSFVSFDDFGINNVCLKLLILIGIVILCFIVSLIIVLSKKEKTIWKRNDYSLKASYGDLFEISKNNDEKIVVIPVNNAFDTIVDEEGSIENPLVSLNTIHGRWIKFITDNGYSVDDLNDKIQEKLTSYKFEKLNKTRGNTKSFELGTIAQLRFENITPNTTYYLMAISKFDENNKACTSKEDIKKCIEKLVEFYDINGQGTPLYVPLIGTKRSRANLTLQKSFDIIKSIMLLNHDEINGKIEIVVYKNDKNSVSIFK